MGNIEQEVLAYLEKPRTVKEVADISDLRYIQVRAATQRLLKSGFLKKVPTEGCGNHEMRYVLCREVYEEDRKMKLRGRHSPKAKSNPKPKPKPKKNLTLVMNVWMPV
jgi:hypothetical protein